MEPQTETPPPVRRAPDAPAADRWGRLPEQAGAIDPQEEAATLRRLADSVAWYESHAKRSGDLFKAFKVVTLAAGAAIPVLVGVGFTPGLVLPAWTVGAPALAGLLGALIVVVEGLQQLYQWQQNWLAYRSTADALQSEGALYAARAGIYEGAAQPHKLLASRVEQLMGREHQPWTGVRNDPRGSGGRPSF